MTTHTYMPPKASFIAAIIWRSEGMERTGILTVRMHNGKSYRYRDVPLPVYQDFAAAESAGKFFGAQIKGQFETIDEEQANV